MAWHDDPTGFLEDANAAIKAWLIHASHTGSLATVSAVIIDKFNTATADDAIFPNVPFDESVALGKLPACLIFTHAGDVVLDEETQAWFNTFTTKFKFISTGEDSTNAGDRAEASNVVRGLAANVASMLHRSHCYRPGLNTWDTTIFNHREPPSLTFDVDQFDPFKDTGKGSVVMADLEMDWIHSSDLV